MGRISFHIFRNAFKKCMYLNSELIRGIINFQDVSSNAVELRTDTKQNIIMPPEARLWSDNEFPREESFEANPWHTAIELAVKRLEATEEAIDVRNTIDAFVSLEKCDALFVQKTRNLAFPRDIKDIGKHSSEIATAISECSQSQTSSLHKIGVLVWFCLIFKNGLLGKGKFLVYLKAMYDDDLLPEEDIISWSKTPSEDILKAIPSQSLGVEVIDELKKSIAPFVEWLETAEDDDEDDEGDEDED